MTRVEFPVPTQDIKFSTATTRRFVLKKTGNCIKFHFPHFFHLSLFSSMLFTHILRSVTVSWLLLFVLSPVVDQLQVPVEIRQTGTVNSALIAEYGKVQIGQWILLSLRRTDRLLQCLPRISFVVQLGQTDWNERHEINYNIGYL